MDVAGLFWDTFNFSLSPSLIETLCSQQPSAVAYIGSIGADENGKILERVVRDDGVVPFYHVDTSLPTGTCACLIHEKERCLIANLSAANCYQMSHLLSEPVQKLLDNAVAYYATGFFLTVCPDALVHIGEKASSTDKVRICIYI